MSFSNDPALLVNQLPITIEFPKDETRFLETLNLWARNVANTTNTKTGGLHSLQELFNSDQYFTIGDPNTFRNVYRKCFDMVDLNGGPIVAGATVSFAHNIPPPIPISKLNGAEIYGSATNSDVTPKRMPLPYASQTLTKNIEIYFNDTNVVIINGATQTALTYCTITLEYLKT